MSRKERQEHFAIGFDTETGEVHYARANPVEETIKPDGQKSVTYELASSHPTLGNALSDVVCREEGLRFREVLPRSAANSTRQFFSSSRWTASWEPKDPKPNWGAKPPEDPGKN